MKNSRRNRRYVGGRTGNDKRVDNRNRKRKYIEKGENHGFLYTG